MQPYITIEAPAQDEFIEKRSRFIGYIAPVHNEEEAIAFVNEIKGRHKDATHNVYAYSLREGQLKRFSDDGEPQGTAGKPILEVIVGAELVDVAVVVTRYFGGTLLGTGGLVRAYTQGAQSAVNASTILHMRPAVRCELDISYDFYGKVTYTIPNYGIVVENSDFAEGIRMTLRMPEESLEPFTQQMAELSSGIVAPHVLERLYANFD